MLDVPVEDERKPTVPDRGPDGARLRVSGVDEVHRRVREAILHGDLPPHSRVSQVKLAKELGVSRTPLREALRMLEREGLIESAPHRSAWIAAFSPDDIEHLYASRIVMESLGIQLTVPQLSDGELETLSGHLDQLEVLGKERAFERWESVHRAFHAGLVAHAGTRLVRLTTELSDHAERYRRVYLAQPRAWSPAAVEHAAILDAARARDSDAAARQLALHLARTALTVIATVDPEHDPRPIRVALRLITGAADVSSPPDRGDQFVMGP